MLVYRYILAQEQIVMKKKKKIITSLEVSCIVKKHKIRIGPFTIRQDGYIDVSGNVKICYTNLQKLPLRFGNVYGDFVCHSNKLRTLKGCPVYVAGDFNCYGNGSELTSLRYCPAEVGGDFFCHENNLTSLVGSPSSINGNFNCFLNKLTTLVGAPAFVNGNFNASNCQLVSLAGGPEKVGQSFIISGNYLKDLRWLPDEIGNILAFDSSTSINIGGRNCKVKIIEIQTQERTCDSEFFLPQVVIDNKKYLPIVFNYFRFLDLFSKKGAFNELNFSDIILEIKEGMR
jgi:hypothetical protein